MALAIEQQREPLGVAEAGGALVVLQLGEGAGHAGQAELDELIDVGPSPFDRRRAALALRCAGSSDLYALTRLSYD